MASLNRVFLIGNLTRIPEMRVTPNGTAVCQFSLAINRHSKDADGQSREEVTFLDCEAWAKTAELITKYLTKGSPVMVEGRLRVDSWSDKQSGEKRSKVKVVVENVQFLSAGPARQDQGAPSGEQQDQQFAPAPAGYTGPASEDRHPPRRPPQDKPKPGPEGSAFNYDGNLNEDVPF